MSWDIFLGVMIPIFQLFLLMSIGYFFGRKGVLTKEFNSGITSILVNVTLPILIFHSLSEMKNELFIGLGSSMILASVVAYLFFLLVAILGGNLLPLPDKDRGVYRFTLLFANVSFMGFPVVEQIFGGQALSLAAVFNIPFHILILSLGVLILAQEKPNPKTLLRLLVSPGILATLAGVLFLFLNIPLPSPVSGFLQLAGGITTPMSMILIGSLLSGLKWSSALKNPHIWINTLFRLILIPLGLFFLLSLFNFPQENIIIAVTIAAMPAAASTPILSQKYGGKGQLAGELVLISTGLSFLTLPLLLTLLGLV